ncbi:MAG TPA: hypothetical protein VN081_04165, partial [Dongiaceae bacterium]|nr:hypothetical protein [Dongiaceae bacterium]
MASQKTITINGREYDAVTGMPIIKSSQDAPKSTPKVTPTAPKPASKPAAPHPAHPAGDIHSTVRRSQTLARRAAKKPAAPQKVLNQRPTGRSMDIARSSKVTHFAPHPAAKPTIAAQAATGTKPVRTTATADIPARVHPTVKRALEKKAPQKPVAA